MFIYAGENRFPKCDVCGKVFDVDNNQQDLEELFVGNHNYRGNCETKKEEVL